MVIQVTWVVAGLLWIWQRKDEMPLVIGGFLAYVFSFRFWALANGLTAPVNITPFGFDPMSSEQAGEALGIATLSETILLGVYMLTQYRQLAVPSLKAPPRMMAWLRSRIFLFAAVAVGATTLSRRWSEAQAAGGKVMAFEVSAYLYELPLMLISVAILLALLWRFGGLRGILQKFSAIGIICIVAYLTFGPTGRFQFLGWLLAVTIIATTGETLDWRLAKMVMGFGIAIVLFAVAGALRSTEEDANLRTDSWERLAFAEDANMLDGLALLRQVYPARLPYSYGGEHLEILERPIPRALWPGKPVGGYMNKLGITSAATGFTLGISPGLVGSLYQEGGIVAVVLLSALYGYGLGRVIRFSTRIAPAGGVLIRAICCASLIPLLRGGDLPGIVAWIFMAFWPCFLFLWLQRETLFVRQQRPARTRRMPVRPISAPVPGGSPSA